MTERVVMKDVAKLERERAALDVEIAERRAAERATAETLAASERERAAQVTDVEALNASLTEACEAYMTGRLVWREWLAEFRPLYARLADSKHYPADVILGRHPFAALLGDPFVRARDYER